MEFEGPFPRNNSLTAAYLRNRSIKNSRLVHMCLLHFPPAVSSRDVERETFSARAEQGLDPPLTWSRGCSHKAESQVKPHGLETPASCTGNMGDSCQSPNQFKPPPGKLKEPKIKACKPRRTHTDGQDPQNAQGGMDETVTNPA